MSSVTNVYGAKQMRIETKKEVENVYACGSVKQKNTKRETDRQTDRQRDRESRT